MKKNSAILGAAFLMATSAIGPGFLNNTSSFTQQLLTSFGFVILDTGPLGARIGLRVGDVILAVNGEPLEQLQDIDRRLRAANGRGEIVVLRGARRLALRFRL